MKFFYVIALIILIIPIACAGCKESRTPNTVDMGQIENDGSNNYEYIFKDKINEEQEHGKEPQF